MRILLDQNLSPKLINQLADVIPGLESVYQHDLIGASDPVIFDWARISGFAALISADRDFVRLVELMGPPPKVIRIERCDFRSFTIAHLLPPTLQRAARTSATAARRSPTPQAAEGLLPA